MPLVTWGAEVPSSMLERATEPGEPGVPSALAKAALDYFETPTSGDTLERCGGDGADTANTDGGRW